MDHDRIKKESTNMGGYSPGLQEVSHSAETCTTCKILCQAIEHCYPEVWDAAPYYRAFFFLFEGGTYSNGLGTFGLSISPREFPDTEEDPLEKIRDGWKRRLLHIFSVPGKPCPWPMFTPGIIPSPDLDVLAAQAKAWMVQCESSHKECKTLTQRTLPKRVVQILPGPKPGNCKIRLHETSIAQQAPYVCLSHCWGKHQIIVTNEKNFAQHQKEIPWKSLSTTFQDAVEFTCRIGVEFIWIDSLCIIQDSKADWEKEAVKMASYYSNADLTIAASAAKDGTVGLFPKKQDTDEALELCGQDAKGRPYHVVARTAIDHPFDVEEDEFDQFPLTKRGWVYQEHILSRRFLHFGKREVVWECHSTTRCQCQMIPEEPRSDHATNQVLSAAKYGFETSDVRKRRQLWYENVEAIMNLDFTYVSDRLAATAGVATLLAKGYQGRFLAGLWEDSLIADLCWVINDNGERPDELKNVPSWSWGSVTGDFATLWCQRDLTDSNVTTSAQVVKIDCQPDPPSLIGALTRGVIVMEGKSVAGNLIDEAHDGPPPTMDHLLIIGNNENQETFRTGWFFHPDCQSFWRNSKSTAIRLLKMMQTSGQGRQQFAIYLVLQAQTDKGCYRRIGLLRAHVRKGPQQQTTEADSFFHRFDHFAETTRVQIE